MRFSGGKVRRCAQRRGLVLRGLAAVVLAGVLATNPSSAIAAAPDEIGAWGPVMNFGVAGIHAALLHTGKVLLWSSGPNAVVFDPAGGQIKQAPTLFHADNIHCAGLVVLADGRVLTLGGERIATTATFDPLTEQWTKTADMNFVRWYPSVTVLADGRVLVAGGQDGDQTSQGSDVTKVEVFDPKWNTWSVLAGADHRQDLYAPNYLLPSGDIFEPAPWQSARLDLASRTWSDGPANHWRTSGYAESGAMYAPGQIIRSGGTVSVDGAKQATRRTEIIDMTRPAPVFEETAGMAFPRRRHNMVLLADGSTMAVGGTEGLADDPAQAVLAGEIWSPPTKAWTTVASMSVMRMYHSTALLLPDGRVLAAGGEETDVGAANSMTGQIYSPPYLFRGPRPGIDAAPGAVAYGSAFPIVTKDAAGIGSVALIRPSAVTHAYNMDQRYVPLSFTRTGSAVSATAPPNGNSAPPGWYMLVIKNTAGVPSVAKWVQVGTGPTSGLEPGPGAATAGGVNSRPVAQAGEVTAGGSAAPAAFGAFGAPPVSGRPTAAGGPSGASAPISGDAAASITALSTRRRLSLAEVRRRGVPLSVLIATGPDPDAGVLRVRLFRASGDQRGHAVATVFRAVRQPGVYRLGLRAHGLRAGRYRVEAAIGSSRDALATPVGRALSVVG